MATNRVVRPELLDHLPPDDPEARRSRRDLRLINAFMGNAPWIARRIGEHASAGRRGVAELGAGEGRLIRFLHRRFPHFAFTGMDFAPRPAHFPPALAWEQGDLLAGSRLVCGAAVGTMILHHFQPAALSVLGERLAEADLVVFCEPLRSSLAHLLGFLCAPAMGRVTRHDLHVSVDAGFRRGELHELLGLRSWRFRESIDWRGTLRYVAWRD